MLMKDCVAANGQETYYGELAGEFSEKSNRCMHYGESFSPSVRQSVGQDKKPTLLPGSLLSTGARVVVKEVREAK